MKITHEIKPDTVPTHWAMVDGEAIALVRVEPHENWNKIAAHDEARIAVAREYGIPKHYIKLLSLLRAAKMVDHPDIAPKPKNAPRGKKTGNAAILEADRKPSNGNIRQAIIDAAVFIPFMALMIALLFITPELLRVWL